MRPHNLFQIIYTTTTSCIKMHCIKLGYKVLENSPITIILDKVTKSKRKDVNNSGILFTSYNTRIIENIMRRYNKKL